MLSHFSRVGLFEILLAVALLAPLSMGVLPAGILEWVLCLSPGVLPDPWIKPMSPVALVLQADFLLLSQ